MDRPDDRAGREARLLGSRRCSLTIDASIPEDTSGVSSGTFLFTVPGREAAGPARSYPCCRSGPAWPPWEAAGDGRLRPEGPTAQCSVKAEMRDLRRVRCAHVLFFTALPVRTAHPTAIPRAGVPPLPGWRGRWERDRGMSANFNFSSDG